MGERVLTQTGSPPSRRHKENHLKLRIQSFFDSAVFTVIMSLVTMYAVYGEDIKMLAFDKSSDSIFSALSSASCFLFSLEIIVHSWCQEGYLELPGLAKWRKAKAESSHLTRRMWRQKVKNYKNAIQFGSFYFWLDVLGAASMIAEVSIVLCFVVDF